MRAATAQRVGLVVLGALLLADSAMGLGLIGYDLQGTAAAQVTVSGDGLGLDGSVRGNGFAFLDEFAVLHATPSMFSIGFRIDGDGELALDGVLSSLNGFHGWAFVRVLTGAQELFAVRLVEDGIWDFSFPAAVLPAGLYTLEAYAAVGVDQIAIYDFNFHVRDTALPIPEPAAVVLLGGGIAFLGARARRLGSR